MASPSLIFGLLTLVLAAGLPSANAQTTSAPERRLNSATLSRVSAAVAEGSLEDGSDILGKVTLPAKIRVLRDVAYGSDTLQHMDVYMPQSATTNAPVLLMVHGGAWRGGDKAAQAVVENKAAYWVSKGWVLVSINYRLQPNSGPLEQLQDLVQALGMAQSMSGSWGADPGKFVLMGHSSGAHLVALLSASPEMALSLGTRPWLGAVLLDSAALDVPALMRQRHLRLFDAAFSNDPEYWRVTSPVHQLNASGPPVLLVCSMRRSNSCSQAEQFAAQVQQLKRSATVLHEEASHRDINQTLGQPGPYTEEVNSFLTTVLRNAGS